MGNDSICFLKKNGKEDRKKRSNALWQRNDQKQKKLMS